LAEALKKEFGAEAKMIEGKGGIFDVHANGTKVWCKHEKDRFPENQEVIDLIREIAQ